MSTEVAWLITLPDGAVVLREGFQSAASTVREHGGTARMIVYTGHVIGEGGPYFEGAPRGEHRYGDAW